MDDIVALLKEQNRLTTEHNNLIENSLGEFKRILQLQAAEAKVSNARAAIIDETLNKILFSNNELLEEFIK